MKKVNVIPIEVKRKCIEMQKQGMTAREIYNQYYSLHYDTKLTGFQSMLKRWKRKIKADDEILETGNLNYNFTPHATTVQIDRDGEIVQSWIKSKAEDNLYLELIDNIKNLPPLKIEKTELETIEDYMLEIPLYDLHFGIADLEHYKETLQEVIDIIKRRNYREINIIIGQDLFHNDDFRGRTASGREIEKVNIRKAWNDAREFYYQIISKAIKHSQKVKVIYSKGNHDESMSWAFTQMIKAEFKDIEIDDEFKERKIIVFGDNFIGITHGEKGQAKSRKLNNMFVIEYPQEFAQAKVREVHAGHLHSERIIDEFGIMARRLSSGNISDEWHNEQGYVGAHKRFMLFEWSLKKLVAIYYV